jgi:putative transposase
MPRTPRQLQWTAAAASHVLHRGHNRDTAFADDTDRLHFLHLLGRYRQRFALRLFHYCLMDNHFHLLVQLPDPRRLSACVAGLLRSYVHYYHRRYRYVGHLWQGRFKSPAVQREGYWLSCGRYIERNPVAAGLTAEPWQYRWSSAAYYALGRGDPLVDENPCYRELSPDPGRRQLLWREFLLADDVREAEVRRAEWALGDDGFRRQMAAVHGLDGDNYLYPPATIILAP